MIDTLDAVYDFLKEYVVPTVDVVRGWQNRAALPNASSYVVVTLLNATRHGKNVDSWDDTTPSTGIDETSSFLEESEVQVDFCGLDEAVVSEQAAVCCLMASGHRAAEFFASYDIGGLFADDPRSMPFQDDQQWVVRYSVTLHLTKWIRKTINNEAFSTISWDIENVDVHHPVSN